MQFDFVTLVHCVVDEPGIPGSDTRPALVVADTDAGRRVGGSAERSEPDLALKLGWVGFADSESPVAGAAASAVRTACCCKERSALGAQVAEAVEPSVEAAEPSVEAVEPSVEALEPSVEAVEPSDKAAEAVEVAD